MSDIFLYFFRLRLIAGVVTVHGVDYEKGKFKTGIENGTLTIANTQVRFFNFFII